MTKLNYDWAVTPAEAGRIQKALRTKLVQKPLPPQIKLIAGADVSFNKFEREVYAGFIVLSFPELGLVDQMVVKVAVDFPYIPGLLSFREIPPLLEAWAKLKRRPDVILVDGQGIAHPRRLGIAAHLGLALPVPTIGVGKSRLYGDYVEPGLAAGQFSDLIDPKTGEVLGAVLRTKLKTKPLFISPGHLCTVDDARNLVLATSKGYRLPEPTRLAHQLVNEFRLTNRES